MRAGDDLEERFFLVRVQAEALLARPLGKSGKYLVWFRALGEPLGQGHNPSIVPGRPAC